MNLYIILCNNCHTDDVEINHQKAEVKCRVCGYVGDIQESTFMFEDFKDVPKMICSVCKKETPKLNYCAFCGNELK